MDSVAQPSKSIIFIRHGQAEHNIVARCHEQHYPDAGLTPQGELQAQSWQREFGTLAETDIIDTIELVLVSPLRRTIQTACHVFASRDTPMQLCFPAREGGWRSKANQPLIAQQPAELQELLESLPRGNQVNTNDIAREIGIPRAEFFDDSWPQLRRILLKRTETTIAVVTHHGVIAAMLGKDADNCEIIESTLLSTGEFKTVKRKLSPWTHADQNQAPIYVDLALHNFSGEGNDAVVLPPEAAVQGRRARSMFCWISTWQTHNYCLVATGKSSKSAAFNLVSYGNGGRFIGVMGYARDFYPREGIPQQVNDGCWHLVGAVYDGSALVIFVDGEVVSTAHEIEFNTRGSHNFLGQSNHAGYENSFMGVMYGLWMYERPLRADEVAGLLQTRPTVAPPPRPERRIHPHDKKQKAYTFAEFLSYRKGDRKGAERMWKESEPLQDELLFQEKWRPQFHFTAEKNWLNDPNGLVHFMEEYHLFFQHNPYGIEHGHMTWGHAISKDLLHWKQLDHALWPDSYGTVFSGCAVVDWQNTGGFGGNDPDQEPCLVAHYTSAGEPFTQSLAHSSDRGRTWARMPAVIPHIRRENRDPKVLWHAPSSKWIMALYLDGADYALLGSSDLKHWDMLSQLSLPGECECPDFFELPVDDSANSSRWVFWGAGGSYFLGSFDGKTFTPGTETPLRAEWGSNGYAAQTYADAPDARRIQVSWMRGGEYPMMPFNQQMSFPVELSLRFVPGLGLRIRRMPIMELKELHGACEGLYDFEIPAREQRTLSTESHLLDVRLKLPQSGPGVTLMIFGTPLSITRPFEDTSEGSLQFDGRHKAPLCCLGEDAVSLQVLVDITSVEIFDMCGEASLHECFLPDHTKPPLALLASSCAVAFNACIVYELCSIWPQPASVGLG